ncbi:MAG TPA: NAD(+) kinase [Gammaproteobacteria bacterium]|jgi:NAD+ kinase|nr:NAD(+) kinase [Gammaproteobacteria bacterium]
MTAPSQFNTVGLMSRSGRANNPGIHETLVTLIKYLQGLKQKLILDDDTAKTLNDPSLPHVPRQALSQHCDLLIVIGGDGSLLHAAHNVLHDEIPVLGVNRGRLGFLTDIHPHKLEKIKAILAGEYVLEKRFLLTATVEHHGKILAQGDALNEVALIPDSVPHMHEFEIYINEQFVCSQDSDGIIVATPTGSTAYALSGGGPILHPQLDAIVIVPMFPHTLSLRPIVIEGNQQITIVITPNNLASPRLTCDGQNFVSAPPGSRITIRKKPEHLHLIHPLDYDYYQTLRGKLHWGHKLQYTE